MPFVVGETIGPYRIIEQLGRGGMATVFKAYHASLDRYVALKALHPAFMEDPNFLARFQREARVVARLEHTHIVPIYDFSEYEGRPYLVMKFIEGETLKARLQSSALDRAQLLAVVEAIGAALGYAHQQGILHRDVKPSNVLLTPDGRIYLADFGLARIAQAGESTLSSDMMLGTPQYISPEQAMGSAHLDERTDIYSFGVMLYEMVVGKVPFSADTPFSIIHDHIYKPLPLPRTVNPNVPEPIERVLLKALAKEPADRFADARSLVRAFAAALLEVEAPAANAAEAIETVADQSPEPEPLPAPRPAALELTLAAILADRSPETAAARESQVAATLDAEKPADLPPLPRFRWRWWQIVLATVFFCICGLLAIGFLQEKFGADASLPPLLQTATAQAGPPAPESPQKEPNPPAQEALSLELARDQVGADQTDPYARVELALAYWDAGQFEAAQAELIRATELAGDNPELFHFAGDQLAKRLLWIESAQMYLEALRRRPQDSPELSDAFHRAVFFAAAIDGAEFALPIAAVAEIDVPLERLARARYLSLYGDLGVALVTLNEVFELKPNMPEALLLQIEIQYQSGERRQALDALQQFRQRAGLAPWLVEYADQFRDEKYARLDQARAQVAQNSTDPWAHLELFDALLAIGEYENAQLSLEAAVEYSDGDPAVFEVAGDALGRAGAWVYAAALYRMMLDRLDLDRASLLEQKYYQALYLSADAEEAITVLSDPENGIPEFDLRLVQARFSLYRENAGSARELIDQILLEKPGLPIALLIEAELYLRIGELETARTLLKELIAARVMPPWVTDQAQQLLRLIPD